jgi:hypothetical protein
MQNNIADLANLVPERFSPNGLHHYDRNFRETNCYSDLLIEVIHNLNLNPVACLGFTLACDFEEDQWTFGKPSHDDLQKLYGIRIEELSLYRPLVDQMICQVQRGAIPLLEVDAYFLPDTVGIDYRQTHAKTTIGITHIDLNNKKLRYFHNATFTECEGEDFDGILFPSLSSQDGYLLPYCEILKLNKTFSLSEEHLKKIAYESATLHFSARASSNPFEAYAKTIESHQEAIIASGHHAYHAYTFVAPRQLGAAHELGASFLNWLNTASPNFASAAEDFVKISNLSKTLVLKLARINHTNKPAKVEALLAEMHDCWSRAHIKLSAELQST